MESLTVEILAVTAAAVIALLWIADAQHDRRERRRKYRQRLTNMR